MFILTPMPGRSESKLARYRLLVDLMAVLVSIHRADEVVAALHERIGTLFAAPITLLALHSQDGSWQCLTLEGENTHRKTLHPQEDGLLERALDGRLTYTNDLYTYARDERLNLRSLDPESNLPYSYSWMGVPLVLDDQPAGVLSIQSYALQAFSDDDLEFLRLLSNHLGIAIENALLRERLELEARTDALTGLGNRRSFVYSGERAIVHHGPVTLAVMDVQDFKRINDHFGHPAGDAVLTQISALLKRYAGPSGQAFRLGGDEFALLLEAGPAEAHARLEALLKDSAAEPWPVPVQVRLNIGLAECHPHQDFEALVREADQRMYDAKVRGVQLDPV